MQHPIFTLIISAILATQALACSDDAAGTDPDGSVPPDTSIDVDVPDADTGIGNPDAGDAGDTIAPQDRRFFLEPMTYFLSSESTWGSVAYFHNESTSIEGRRCAVITSGACYVLECRREAVTIGEVNIEGVPAGTVTISGGSGSDVVLTPGSSDIYNKFSETGSTPHWAPDDTLTLSSTGDTIPTFSATMVFPTAVEVTTPTMDGTPLTIDRTAPLVVEWTPTTDWVRVHIGQGPSGLTIDQMNRVEINCDFQGSTGTGTVPAAILDVFDPSDTPGLWQGLLVGHGTFVDITPGGYPLRLGVWNYVGSDGLVIE